MKLIQALLNQDVFSALLIITGIVVLIRQKHLQASLALLFFIAGYYVTQIPLISGWAVTLEEKYVAQAVVSLCLIVIYNTIDVTVTLLLASLNELILIAINIAYVVGDHSLWWHWMLFSLINYISYGILLCYYGHIERIHNKRPDASRSFVQTLMHVLSKRRDDNKKNRKMAESKA